MCESFGPDVTHHMASSQTALHGTGSLGRQSRFGAGIGNT